MLDYTIRGLSPLPYHLGIMVGLVEEGPLATKIGSDAKNILRAKKKTETKKVMPNYHC
jgi:hypothetical protein